MAKVFNASIQTYIDTHKNLRNSLILVRLSNYTLWAAKETSEANLRFNEKETLSVTLKPLSYLVNGTLIISNQTNYLAAVFNSRSSLQLLSGLSICRTLFVCLILALGSVFFRKDASDVIIGPVLMMIEKIRRIATNPLEAASKEDKEALAKERIEETNKNT
jgi:hypothetical protein